VPPTPTRLAYMGEPGAFGEDACAGADSSATAVPHPTAEAAIAAVLAGDCDAAVLPVHNSVAGSVTQVLALLPRSGLTQTGHVTVHITMALLANPGTRLAHIRTVVSHPVALAQCARLLARLDATAEPAPTTAAAAAALATAPDPARAVLAHARAAALHGLIVLAPDVGDDPAAVTRFVLLERA